MSGYEPGQEWPPPARSWAPPTQTLPAENTWWEHPPAPPPRPRPTWLPATLGILTALTVFVGVMFIAGVPALTSRLPGFGAAPVSTAGDPGVSGTGVPLASPVPEANTSGLTGSAAAARIAPAVVMITSTFGYQQAGGAGTGIVLTGDGEVLTNNHVINGATRIQAVDVGNGRRYTATVIGYDNSHDLALLRLRGASGLKTAQVGDSSRLSVGQPVVASGNAGGTGSTTSVSGMITSLDQSITANDEMTGVSERLAGLIEVDAAIQPGDSGGPLVDLSGRLIGVDTAASVGVRFQGAGGRGYAIPISGAMTTVRQIESGQPSSTVHIGATAFLGVLLSSGRGGDQNGNGFGNGGDGTGGNDGNGTGGNGTGGNGGATVSGVVSGGTAARAGLVAGDVITRLDGHAIDSANTLSRVMSGLHPGDRVRLGWLDGTGSSRSATARLDAGPPA